MAQSSQGCEKGPDIRRDPKFSHPHAFAQMVFALRNSFSTGNIPPVLQGSTYMVPYPCDSSLSILSEGAISCALRAPAHGDFIVMGHAVMFSVAHIPHLP